MKTSKSLQIIGKRASICALAMLTLASTSFAANSAVLKGNSSGGGNHSEAPNQEMESSSEQDSASTKKWIAGGLGAAAVAIASLLMYRRYYREAAADKAKDPRSDVRSKEEVRALSERADQDDKAGDVPTPTDAFADEKPKAKPLAPPPVVPVPAPQIAINPESVPVKVNTLAPEASGPRPDGDPDGVFADAQRTTNTLASLFGPIGKDQRRPFNVVDVPRSFVNFPEMGTDGAQERIHLILVPEGQGWGWGEIFNYAEQVVRSGKVSGDKFYLAVSAPNSKFASAKASEEKFGSMHYLPKFFKQCYLSGARHDDFIVYGVEVDQGRNSQ